MSSVGIVATASSPMSPTERAACHRTLGSASAVSLIKSGKADRPWPRSRPIESVTLTTASGFVAAESFSRSSLMLSSRTSGCPDADGRTTGLVFSSSDKGVAFCDLSASC